MSIETIIGVLTSVSLIFFFIFSISLVLHESINEKKLVTYENRIVAIEKIINSQECKK